MSVVAFADDRIGEGIQSSGTIAAGAFVEIARVLLQERGQDGASDESAGHGVGIARAEALGIALCALTVSAEAIGCLLDAGDAAYQEESHRIDDTSPCQLKFLLRAEGSRVQFVGDVEIWENAKHTLLFFHLKLLLRDFDLGEPDFTRAVFSTMYFSPGCRVPEAFCGAKPSAVMVRWKGPGATLAKVNCPFSADVVSATAD